MPPPITLAPAAQSKKSAAGASYQAYRQLNLRGMPRSDLIEVLADSKAPWVPASNRETWLVRICCEI